jgi:predicted ArsR family transcriptional regulator
MLDLLVESGSGTASTLGEALPVSRQAVAKHLVVLENVDLVASTVVGRERIYQPNPAQLERAAAQLDEVGAAWDRRLSRIAAVAEELEERRLRGEG